MTEVVVRKQQKEKRIKYALSALFVAALFWLIRPENSPAHINNQVQSAPKATQVDKASVELPKERAQAKPEKIEPAGETVAAPMPAPEPAPVPQPTIPTGGKFDWMAAAGIKPEDYHAVDDIVSKESGWRTDVWNSTGSGAYGLCQALPASKMASAGDDYMTNPVTQLKWCNQYAQAYGGWHKSKQFRDCTGLCYSVRIAANTYKDHTWW